MELHAPPHWQRVDFISDLHLQANEPDTFSAWSDYVQHTSANALFILGDLFEVWVGDDLLSANTGDSGFERSCVEVLQRAAQRVNLFIMHGNRDFLMGSALMQACSATLLDDPCVLVFGGQRWLLTHGDALCLKDTEYLQFRKEVRSTDWIGTFLQQPLADRLAQARAMRTRSEARKLQKTIYTDVDSAAACEWLQRAQARHMVHGHTHQPDDHLLDGDKTRWVLSDWDLGAQPARAQVLRISTTGAQNPVKVERLPPHLTMAANSGASTATAPASSVD